MAPFDTATAGAIDIHFIVSPSESTRSVTVETKSEGVCRELLNYPHQLSFQQQSLSQPDTAMVTTNSISMLHEKDFSKKSRSLRIDATGSQHLTDRLQNRNSNNATKHAKHGSAPRFREQNGSSFDSTSSGRQLPVGTPRQDPPGRSFYIDDRIVRPRNSDRVSQSQPDDSKRFAKRLLSSGLDQQQVESRSVSAAAHKRLVHLELRKLWRKSKQVSFEKHGIHSQHSLLRPSQVRCVTYRCLSRREYQPVETSDHRTTGSEVSSTTADLPARARVLIEIMNASLADHQSKGFERLDMGKGILTTSGITDDQAIDLHKSRGENDSPGGIHNVLARDVDKQRTKIEQKTTLSRYPFGNLEAVQSHDDDDQGSFKGVSNQNLGRSISHKDHPVVIMKLCSRYPLTRKKEASEAVVSNLASRDLFPSVSCHSSSVHSCDISSSSDTTCKYSTPKTDAESDRETVQRNNSQRRYGLNRSFEPADDSSVNGSVGETQNEEQIKLFAGHGPKWNLSNFFPFRSRWGSRRSSLESMEASTALTVMASSMDHSSSMDVSANAPTVPRMHQAKKLENSLCSVPALLLCRKEKATTEEWFRSKHGDTVKGEDKNVMEMVFFDR